MKTSLRRFRLNSLRSRLMLLVALAITPIAVMTIVGGVREREQAVKASEENLRRLTRLAAANEAQSIEGARQILVDLSTVPDLIGPTARCNALLSNVLDRNEGYVNFGLIQLDGDVSCSAVPMLHPVNLGDRSHFKRAIAERRFIAGDYVFGRVIRKHTINLTYPVTNHEGKVVAVVFAAMDLADLDTFINDINLPPGSILSTVDSRGGLISRRPDPERWLGTQVSTAMRAALAHPSSNAMVIKGDDGVERLHAFAHVGALGLTDYTVSIGIPTETITSSARRDQVSSLLALAATTMLALLAAWLAGDILIVQRAPASSMRARRSAAWPRRSTRWPPRCRKRRWRAAWPNANCARPTSARTSSWRCWRTSCATRSRRSAPAPSCSSCSTRTTPRSPRPARSSRARSST
jgi:hypothetical protein